MKQGPGSDLGPVLFDRCWLWGTKWGSCMCGTWKWKILTKQSESSCSPHMMLVSISSYVFIAVSDIVNWCKSVAAAGFY